MNNMVIFFVGCVTFTLMMLIKIPVKKLTWDLAQEGSDSREGIRRRYHLFNLSIILLTMLVSFICYCFVLVWLRDTHFKLCCALKGASVAIAFYAVYEQWFGEGSLEEK